MKTLHETGGHARQGDVLIRRVKDHAQVPAKRVVPILAKGEVTGHDHRYRGGAVGYADDDAGLAQMVDVLVEEPLIHQEHGPIVTPPGRYEVPVQVEDTSGEILRVMD